MIYALTNVNPCFGNAVMNLQTDRQPDKELDQKPCTLLVALNSYCLLARFSGPLVIYGIAITFKLYCSKSESINNVHMYTISNEMSILRR